MKAMKAPDFSKLPTIHEDKAYRDAVAKRDQLRAELPGAEREVAEAAERFERLNKGLEFGEAKVKDVDDAELESARAERRLRGLRGAIVEAEKRVTTAHAEAVAKIRGPWRKLQGDLGRRFLLAMLEIRNVERENTALRSAFAKASGLRYGVRGRDGTHWHLPLDFPLPRVDGGRWRKSAIHCGFDLPEWPVDPPAPREEPPTKRPLDWYPSFSDFRRGRVVFEDGRDQQNADLTAKED